MSKDKKQYEGSPAPEKVVETVESAGTADLSGRTPLSPIRSTDTLANTKTVRSNY